MYEIIQSYWSYSDKKCIFPVPGDFSEYHKYACPDCGKTYLVYNSLRRHQKHECVNSDPKYICEICSYRTCYNWCMKNHKKKYHKELLAS